MTYQKLVNQFGLDPSTINSLEQLQQQIDDLGANMQHGTGTHKQAGLPGGQLNLLTNVPPPDNQPDGTIAPGMWAVAELKNNLQNLHLVNSGIHESNELSDRIRAQVREAQQQAQKQQPTQPPGMFYLMTLKYLNKK